MSMQVKFKSGEIFTHESWRNTSFDGEFMQMRRERTEIERKVKKFFIFNFVKVSEKKSWEVMAVINKKEVLMIWWSDNAPFNIPQSA